MNIDPKQPAEWRNHVQVYNASDSPPWPWYRRVWDWLYRKTLPRLYWRKASIMWWLKHPSE